MYKAQYFHYKTRYFKGSFNPKKYFSFMIVKNILSLNLIMYSNIVYIEIICLFSGSLMTFTALFGGFFVFYAFQCIYDLISMELKS